MEKRLSAREQINEVERMYVKAARDTRKAISDGDTATARVGAARQFELEKVLSIMTGLCRGCDVATKHTGANYYATHMRQGQRKFNMSYKNRNRYYGNNSNRGNKEYSPQEKRAYYKGQGYRAAYEDKAMQLNTQKEVDSFRNGFNSLDTSRLGPNKRAKNGGR